jgi:hypothetical protein
MLATCGRAVATLGVYELRFRKDASALGAVEQALFRSGGAGRR